MRAINFTYFPNTSYICIIPLCIIPLGKQNSTGNIELFSNSFRADNTLFQNHIVLLFILKLLHILKIPRYTFIIRLRTSVS